MKKQINFAQGAWSEKDWLYAASSLYKYRYSFKQHSNYISNLIPDFKEGDFPYISMYYKDPFNDVFTVSADMSFDYYGAPIIVITGDPAVLEDGNLEYGEHFEVVLYENGINIWHLDYKNQVRTALVRVRFPVNAKEIYSLTVSVDPDNGTICASLAGQNISYIVPCPTLKTFKNIYAGVTACEGINRIYRIKFE